MTNHNNSKLQFDRIVFFSDAVFAIAITLLIIEIKVPHLEHSATDREFWIALAKLIPNFIGYFFSFFVIGAYWIGHHKIYGYIVRWNYGLVWRNVFFLMAIAFIPFSTAFFSEYFTRFVPLALYATSFAVAGLLEIWQWRYAAKNNLLDETANPSEISHISWRMAVMRTVGIVAILIGLINPVFAGFAFWLIAITNLIIKRRFEKNERDTEITDDDLEREN